MAKSHEEAKADATESAVPSPTVYAFPKGTVRAHTVDYHRAAADCVRPTPHRDAIVRFLKAAVDNK